MVMIVGNFDQNLPKLVGMVDNAAKAVPQKMAAGPVIQEAKSAPAKAVPQKMAAGPVIQEAKSAPAKAVPQKMAAGPVIQEAKSAPAKAAPEPSRAIPRGGMPAPAKAWANDPYVMAGLMASSGLRRFKEGGAVKASSAKKFTASSRGDGIAQRGKTRGKMR
jgi:hypothetical protein